MNKTKAYEDQVRDVQEPSFWNFRRNLLISIGAILFLLFLAALFIPTLDGPNGRRAAREANAVGKLRRITTLQNDYAVSHPTAGFACHLSPLKPTAASNENYDSDAFLLSADHDGCRIEFTSCGPETDGVVTSYRVTAVPLEPGKSGIRAFCTDQTGALWYDASGSPEKCLSARREIN